MICVILHAIWPFGCIDISHFLRLQGRKEVNEVGWFVAGEYFFFVFTKCPKNRQICKNYLSM
jgi:hypothetical protein